MKERVLYKDAIKNFAAIKTHCKVGQKPGPDMAREYHESYQKKQDSNIHKKIINPC